MLNDTEKQEKVEKLKKYIDEARKAHDTATVEALGEKLFDLTGVKEPEFDAEVSSGNPKLDRLKKALIQSIAARDEPTEVILREKIKDMEAESEPIIPEMDVVLAEEPEALICITTETPTIETMPEPVIKEPLTTEPVQENYTDEPDAGVLIAYLFKDALMATQLASLNKAGLLDEKLIRNYLEGGGDENDSKIEKLVKINGIGKASAKTILETLGYEA
jgi:hypothetical protein